MKTNLGHVRINVSDIQQAKEWYTNVLGFEIDSQWPVENPNWYSFKSETGADLSIMEVSDVSGVRLNFGIENLIEFWEKIKDEVVIVETLFKTPWSDTYKFTIYDPYGNELSFVEE